MPYRINWKSRSAWAGTERTEHIGKDVFKTREEAEAALAEMNKDERLLDDVHFAAIGGQGVESWLEVEEA